MILLRKIICEFVAFLELLMILRKKKTNNLVLQIVIYLRVKHNLVEDYIYYILYIYISE